MLGRKFWNLADVDDTHLEASLAKFVGAHARLDARVVAHLAEIEARRIHLLSGYSSMFDYCRRRLGLSEFEAFCRIAVARTARKYPVIFEMLDTRELHLSAVCEVREYLNDENHLALLRDIAGRTKLQVREVLAEWFPRPDAVERLRTLPTMDPLSPGRYRLELTLNATQKAKIEEARDLMSHVPGGRDLAFVIERALDLLISRVRSRRFGEVRGRGNGSHQGSASRNEVGTKRHKESRRSQSGNTRTLQDTTEVMTPDPSVVLETLPGQRTFDDAAVSRSTEGSVAYRATEGPAVGLKAASTIPSQTTEGTAVCRPAHASTDLNVEGTLAGQSVGAKASAKSSAEDPTATAARVGLSAPRKRRHIANVVRRTVSTRDGAQCSFVAPDGRRCEATAFVQYHHVRAWARSGDDTAENLVLLCFHHNALMAELEFGLHEVRRLARRKVRTG